MHGRMGCRRRCTPVVFAIRAMHLLFSFSRPQSHSGLSWYETEGGFETGWVGNFRGSDHPPNPGWEDSFPTENRDRAEVQDKSHPGFGPRSPASSLLGLAVTAAEPGYLWTSGCGYARRGGLAGVIANRAARAK